jgi:hypothetical protein
MGDRIDPSAGWFNLGDRQQGEVSGLEDSQARLVLPPSRITVPRSQESAGMEARTGELVTRNIPAMAFIVNDNSIVYDKIHGGIFGLFFVSGSTHADSLGVSPFFFPVLDMPTGSSLVSLSMRSYMKVSTDPTRLAITATFASFDKDGISAASTGPEMQVSSTSNGSAVTDSSTTLIFGTSRLINLDVNYYAIYVSVLNTGYVLGDANLYNVQYQYTLPG